MGRHCRPVQYLYALLSMGGGRSGYRRSPPKMCTCHYGPCARLNLGLLSPPSSSFPPLSPSMPVSAASRWPPSTVLPGRTPLIIPARVPSVYRFVEPSACSVQYTLCRRSATSRLLIRPLSRENSGAPYSFLMRLPPSLKIPADSLSTPQPSICPSRVTSLHGHSALAEPSFTTAAAHQPTDDHYIISTRPPGSAHVLKLS